jgi:hypothetical protein
VVDVHVDVHQSEWRVVRSGGPEKADPVDLGFTARTHRSRVGKEREFQCVLHVSRWGPIPLETTQVVPHGQPMTTPHHSLETGHDNQTSGPAFYPPEQAPAAISPMNGPSTPLPGTPPVSVPMCDPTHANGTSKASPSSVAGMYSMSSDGDGDGDDQERADADADSEQEAANVAGELGGLRNMIPSELPVFPTRRSPTRSPHASPDRGVVHSYAPGTSEPRHSHGNTISSSHTQVGSFAPLAPTPEDKHAHAATARRSVGFCFRARGSESDLEWPFPPTKIGRAWCDHCGIWKPDRSHHCRHCGTCVLEME